VCCWFIFLGLHNKRDASCLFFLSTISRERISLHNKLVTVWCRFHFMTFLCYYKQSLHLGPVVIDVFFCFGSRARTGFLFAIYVCILLGIIPDDLVLVLVHAAPTATTAASWRATPSFPVALNWSPTHSYPSKRKFQNRCFAFFQGSPAIFQRIHWISLPYLIQDFYCRVTYWAPLEMLLCFCCRSHSYYCSLMKSNTIFSCCFELIPNT
jgi:hypothetical protein